MLVFVFCGVFAPLIAPYDPYKNDLMNVLMPPSAEHWFGTDELGRDLFSRVIYGARISLIEGVFSVALAMAIGVPIGIVSGYARRRASTRSSCGVIDVLLAFPGVLLAIVIISVLGPGLTNAIIAVAVYTIPIFARLARGSTLVVKDEPYVEAARAAGLSDLRILSRHIFPNISATLFVMMTLRVAISILTAASLSLPRPRRAGAAARMGRDAVEQPQRHADRAACRAVSRARHHPAGVRPEPVPGRAAPGARSQTAGPLQKWSGFAKKDMRMPLNTDAYIERTASASSPSCSRCCASRASRPATRA